MQPTIESDILSNNRVKTANEVIAGTVEAGSEVRSFKGIPFAAPPVGELRWRPPQPARSWEGVRHADHFGPRPMQLPIFGDMGFRSDGMSEDCLYLNVWTPAASDQDRLPVLVYFYGGGLVAGDGSEPRYDGESIARTGIVALTVNYRLSVFGFFAHPELTQESPDHSSSNYGFLDQAAALRWVQQNIAAFGGDPARVTIAGESAGSISVCALMVSPLSKDLIAGAIGSSGSIMGTLPAVPLVEAEQKGLAFATGIGAPTLAELRAMPATQLLDATANLRIGQFSPTIDGYFFPEPVEAIFAAGEQAHIPLMVGWNSEEAPYLFVFGEEAPTRENFVKALHNMYGDRAQEALRHYAASSDEETLQAATDLAGDRFIGYSTWKWADLHGRTGDAPVYRYLYAHARPEMTPEMGDAVAGLAGGVVSGDEAQSQRLPPARGAVHSADIEYAMGTLATNTVYAWTADDYKVSEIMQEYYANFVKTGDPNGSGLPVWPPINRGETPHVMRLDVESVAEPERHRERYLFLNQFNE